jgi:hypothetical protein
MDFATMRLIHSASFYFAASAVQVHTGIQLTAQPVEYNSRLPLRHRFVFYVFKRGRAIN